jgi:tRNA dimethylallyltransferase
MDGPLLLAILGSTASGKSALALQIAKELRGEIVNCDAMQMIRFLDIGTAKPSQAEREQVSHHLYDIIDPDGFFSAGAYMKAARRTCREIASRDRVPIVVGGTGLYFRALLDGIFEGPGRSEEIRRRLMRAADRKGNQFLHSMLLRKDPEAALRIQPGDRVRTIRALEVYFVTGKAISELQKTKRSLSDFTILKYGLRVPREDLYDRINRRVVAMFRRGLLREVELLMERGYSPGAKGFEALGYRHALAVLRGKITLEEAIERTQRDTRRYAKRQMTWFRSEHGVQWLDGVGEDPAVEKHLLAWVQKEGERF